MLANRIFSGSRPSLPIVFFCSFMAILWLAGGASRADALGQTIVRSVASLGMIFVFLQGRPPALGKAKPVAWLLAGMIVLVLLQLVPMPPSMWTALPGRAIFTDILAAGILPWRPLAIEPAATVNAAASLLVPTAILVLMTVLTERERAIVPGLLLLLLLAAGLLSILQFSGRAFDNPLINDSSGQISGNFANRNHFALFVALGIPLVVVWGFGRTRIASWQAVVVLAAAIMFTLLIVTIGSRAGIVLGLIAVALGLLLGWKSFQGRSRRLPRWVLPAALIAFVGAIALLVVVSVAAGRALAIDRLFTVDIGQDARSRALPTLLEMIRLYFPLGSGLGGFDTVFRIQEPFDMLSLYYLNHAHNDYLEVVIDAGLPGLVLLAASVIWWLWASVRVWRGASGQDVRLGQLGSGMILLILVASIFDYPARTPMLMAMIVIASLWLHWGARAALAAALPAQDQSL